MGLVIDVHEDSKIVEIWLDHRDQNDLQLSNENTATAMPTLALHKT